MRIVNFIGYGDKTELMLYVAKLLQSVGNSRILFIDSSETQKCRCIIPAIVNDDKYITSFEDIDIAIGFQNHKEIVKYLASYEQEFSDYDYAFIDTNCEEMCKNFSTENSNYAFCVSSYDKYDILKTVSLVNEISENKKDYIEKITMHRIYIYSIINTSDEKYIDHSFEDMQIKWSPNKIHLPMDQGDMSVIIQNQYAEKMKFKELSSDYKNGIIDIVSVIMDRNNKGEIARVLKNIERRV